MCIRPSAHSALGKDGGQPVHRGTLKHPAPSYCQNGRFLLTTVHGLCSGSALLSASEAQAACPRPPLPANGALTNRGDALPPWMLTCCCGEEKKKASIPSSLFGSPSHGILCCHGGVLACRESPLSFRGRALREPLQRIARSFLVRPQHRITPESIPAMQQNLSISCCLFVCSSIKALQLLEAPSPPSAGEEALGRAAPAALQLPVAPSTPPGPSLHAQPQQLLSRPGSRAMLGWFETSASIYSPDSPPYHTAKPSLGCKESGIPAPHRPA